jgi:hypothetical protein
VVGSTALVAGGSPGTTSKASPEASCESPTRRTTCTASHSWVGAVAGQVTSKAARVATAAGASSAQAKGRAVSLDVTKTLAVVALLSCPLVSACVAGSSRLTSRTLGGARMGASIRLVAGLLACFQSVSAYIAHSGRTDSCSRASRTRSTLQRSGRCCRT